MSEIIRRFNSTQLCWWHTYGVLQWLFLRVGPSKRCDITQQRYTQLFTKPRLIHLPAPWCPPFISQDSVKLSVITLGSGGVTGVSANTHHPISLLVSSVSCGPPCAWEWKIQIVKCHCCACECTVHITAFYSSTLFVLFLEWIYIHNHLP